MGDKIHQHHWNENKMHSNGKEITILMLRHGERADEVESDSDSFYRRSTKDRIDPALTENGHQQAIEAFRRIMPFLQGKKVAMFSSPLQRTLVTAAMIGMIHTRNDIDFCLLGSSSALPIIVLNGLCDCAAHVQIVGGAFDAVRKGYVDGAAMACNSYDEISSDHCKQQEQEQQQQHDHQSSPLHRLLVSIPALRKLKRPIQFFKEHMDGFVPMSGPIGDSKSSNTTATTDTIWTATTSKSLPSQGDTTPTAKRAWDDCFSRTLNRLVRIAASHACDVCVVVTHREGIRDLIKTLDRQKKGNPHERRNISTPYCCIGHFSVRMKEDDNTHDGGAVEWELHGVVPYEKFGSEGTTNVLTSTHSSKTA